MIDPAFSCLAVSQHHWASLARAGSYKVNLPDSHPDIFLRFFYRISTANSGLRLSVACAMFLWIFLEAKPVALFFRVAVVFRIICLVPHLLFVSFLRMLLLGPYVRRVILQLVFLYVYFRGDAFSYLSDDYEVRRRSLVSYRDSTKGSCFCSNPAWRYVFVLVYIPHLQRTGMARS